jgi:uncharacterized membrane protein YdjX (TVP38/TMEM64 family)
MFIPEHIYEKLPALYAIAGAAAMLLFGVNAGTFVFSGLLFIAAALVYVLRRSFRSDRAKEMDKRRRQRRARGGKSAETSIY